MVGTASRSSTLASRIFSKEANRCQRAARRLGANPLDMIKDRNKIALSKPFPMIGNGKAMGLITDMLDEMQSR